MAGFKSGRDRWLLVAVSVVLVLALAACEDNKRLVVDDGTDAPGVTCIGQESPAAVLATLIDAYHQRDIAVYAPLLHPDFRFYFQDGDAPAGLEREYWTRDEDSTGTAGLLNSPVVSNIVLDLTYGSATPATEAGLEHTMKIRIRPTRVDVDDVDGTTYRVDGDIQDMFFVNGAGADSLCWYLVEWRDIAAGAGPGAQNDGKGAATSSKTTWGWLKVVFE